MKWDQGQVTDFWLICSLHDKCVDKYSGSMLYGNGETEYAITKTDGIMYW
jgi:nitrite reductase/ring-hydroxylating ferredoxin subunit